MSALQDIPIGSLIGWLLSSSASPDTEETASDFAFLGTDELAEGTVVSVGLIVKCFQTVG